VLAREREREKIRERKKLGKQKKQKVVKNKQWWRRSSNII
jgi:hypothetical protein